MDERTAQPARHPLKHVLRAAAAALLGAAGAAHAGGLVFCDRPPELDGIRQDRVFRFAAVVRDVLRDSGAPAVLVARSGQDLARFGQRYSHAGISLAASANAPGSVRQLYYACDEKAPRLFDQGVAGFVAGMHSADEGYVAIVVPPPAAAQALAVRALDNAAALRLLGATYSANAYPFSARYQNCNQWVAETLAEAWGEPEPQPQHAREGAQAWLSHNGYQPTVMDASAPWLALLQPFVPFVHDDDHPPEDRASRHYRVSMPQSLEAFVRAQWPGSRRVEICHAGARVVVHEGWTPVAEGCQPSTEDQVVVLD